MRNSKRFLATLTAVAISVGSLLLPVSANESATAGANPAKDPIFRLNYADVANDSLGQHKVEASKSGTVGAISAATGVDGTANAAMHFDGNSYIKDLSLSTLLGNPEQYNALSLSVWVKPERLFVPEAGGDAVAARGNILHTAGWSGNGDLQAFITKDVYTFCTRSNTNREVAHPCSTVGEWLLLTYTYDSTAKTAMLYLNGAPVKTHNCGDNAYAIRFEKQMIIGADWKGTGCFAGDMQDLCIYDYVLTATEVERIYGKMVNSSAQKLISQEDLNASTLAGGTLQTEAGVLGGTALRFDGQTYFTSNALNDQTCKAITVAAWVCPDRVYMSDRGVLFNANGDWGSDPGDVQVFLQHQVLRGGMAFSSAYKDNHQTTFSATTWTHLAFSYDSVTQCFKLYVNGVLQTYKQTGSHAVQFGTWSVGANKNGGDLFSGLMQDFAVYNAALTGSELAALAASDPIRSASLTLTDAYCLDFFADDVFDANTLKVSAVQNGESLTVTQTAENGRIRIRATVEPKCFGDEIAVTASGKIRGEARSFTKAYSVASYCTDTLADKAASAELKALVTSILHYGAEAQRVASYKTDALIDAALETPSYATPSGAAVTVANQADSVTFGSVAVTFGARTALTVAYQGTMPKTLVVKVEDRVAEYELTDNEIVLHDISPAEYGATVTVTLGAGGSSLSCSVGGCLAAQTETAMLGAALAEVGANALAYLATISANA